MTRTPLAYLRYGLCAVAGFDLLLLARFVFETPAGQGHHPLAPLPLLAFLHQPAVLAVIVAVGIGALVRFARRPGSIGAAGTCLFMLAVLSETHAASREGPYRNFYPVGLAMLGWVLGTAASRFARPGNLDVVQEEAAADAGARGAIAAFYLNAVISKLLASGLGWADGYGLQGVLLGHGIDSGYFPALSRLVVEHRSLAIALQVFTLVAEGAGVLLIVRRPLVRALAAGTIVFLHVGIRFTTEIAYVESLALVVLFGIPWAALAARIRREPVPVVDPPPLDRRTVGLFALGVAAFIVLGTAFEVRTYAHLHEHHRGN